jgi:predicted DCC family thiol-disulfide oxidoreductase YuxK
MIRPRPRRRGYVVFYDGTCELCRRICRYLAWLRADAPLMFVDASDPAAVAQWPQIDYHQAQDQVFVLDPRGGIHRGFGSVVRLMEAAAPVSRMFSPLLRLPGVYHLGQLGYDMISHRRHQISRTLFGKT